MAKTQTSGMIETYWGMTICLPLDKMAVLLDLLAEGLVHKNHPPEGDDRYRNWGFVHKDADGERPRLPEVTVLTQDLWTKRFLQGQKNQADIKRAEEAKQAELALERGEREPERVLAS